MEIKYKKIGITGASGFVGKHLTCLFDKSNINYKIYDKDIFNEKNLHTFFQNNNIEQIIHLIGSFNLPFENQLSLNALSVQKVLETGKKYNLKKIIYASTGAVYGEPAGDESYEDDPLQPNTLYGLSKSIAEEITKYYQTNHGIIYIILRFPNIYGEGNDKGVVYNFIKGIKETGGIIIEGDGKQARNFLHVSDACEAIFRCLSYDKSNIFNISNPKLISINELVGILKKRCQFKIKYSKSVNNLKSLSLNVEKVKKELDFRPKITDLHI